MKAADKELKAWSWPRGSSADGPAPASDPSVAARILADVGDVTRFADRNRFASWTGTAPLDASSGEQIRHRLSRAGNRQINHVLHIMATVQLRNDTEGRAYYDRARPTARPRWKPCGRQTTALRHRLPAPCSTTPIRQDDEDGPGRATGATTLNPARPAHNPTPALRTSHSRTRHDPA